MDGRPPMGGGMSVAAASPVRGARKGPSRRPTIFVGGHQISDALAHSAASSLPRGRAGGTAARLPSGEGPAAPGGRIRHERSAGEDGDRLRRRHCLLAAMPPCLIGKLVRRRRRTPRPRRAHHNARPPRRILRRSEEFRRCVVPQARQRHDAVGGDRPPVRTAAAPHSARPGRRRRRTRRLPRRAGRGLPRSRAAEELERLGLRRDQAHRDAVRVDRERRARSSARARRPAGPRSRPREPRTPRA